jgi:hypothetical protein
MVLLLKELLSDEGAFGDYNRTIRFPILHSYGVTIKPRFLEGIVVNPDIEDSLQTMLYTYIRRIQAAEQYLRADSTNHINMSYLGKLWIAGEGDVDSILLSVTQQFPTHLNKLAKVNYLDVLANITEDDVPICPIKDRSKPLLEKPVVSVDLMDPNGKLLSTILVWDDYLSPEFVEYSQTSGFNQLTWFKESEDKSGKDRLIRVESHLSSGAKPFFVKYGEGSRMKLYQADYISRFGDIKRRLSDYVTLELYNFIFGIFRKTYGLEFAKVNTPPLFKTDLLVHSLNSEFNWHSDGKEMLFDPNINGREIRKLIVPTHCLNNNQKHGAAKLMFREKGGSQRTLGSLSLGPVAFHLQLYGSQDGIEHQAKCSKKEGANLRYVDSHRMTRDLQVSGMAKIVSASTIDNIPVYGIRSHYKLEQKWMKESDTMPIALGKTIFEEKGSDIGGLGSKPSYIKKAATSLGEVQPDVSPPKLKTPLVDLHYFPRHASGLPHWPILCISKTLMLPESVGEFLTRGDAVRHLNKNKLTVTTFLPNESGGNTPISHPPLWDHGKGVPVKPGTLFPIIYINKMFQLHHHQRSSATWSSSRDKLVAVVLYHEYKSELPFSESLLKTWSAHLGEPLSNFDIRAEVVKHDELRCPMIELWLVEKKKDRRGFITMGGGGNPSAIGHYTSVGGKSTTGEDLSGPKVQELSKNKRNCALQEKGEQQGRISVFLADDFLANDSSHLHESRSDMCCYLGPYVIEQFSQKKDGKETVRKELEFYKKIFKKEIKDEWIAFRKVMHCRYHLVPDNDLDFWGDVEQWKQWKHLLVRIDDPRKICIDFPPGLTMNDIFKSSDKPGDSLVDGPFSFDYNNIYKRFFVEGRHKAFLRLLDVGPTESNVSSKKLRKSCGSGSDTDDSTGNKAWTTVVERDSEDDSDEYPAIRAITPNPIKYKTDLSFVEETHGGLSLQLAKPRQVLGSNELLIHLHHISVSVAARIMKLNVDDNDKIGPIVDFSEKDKSLLDNGYSQLFGLKHTDMLEGTCTEYLSELGAIHQLIAMPSFLRCQDPHRVYLQECIGCLRSERKGI